MSKKFKYINLDRILSKIYRDLGIEEISETDVIEWSAEALEAIGAISLYEEAVAFIEVENYHADLPCGMHSIMQIARNNHWVKEEKDICLNPANILLDCTTEQISQQANTGCGCSNTTSVQGVPVDCDGRIIGDFEVAYYRPYFDLQYEYHGWCKSNVYTQQYTPVRLSNHSFFNSIVCEEEDFNNLYQSTQDEYTIIGDRLRFSFKEGSIAIAYHRQVVDPETGYPMIPDDYSVITAITMYITMKYMGRMWYLGREGYGDKFQKAEQDWQWYCKQAGNTLLAPYGEDEFQKILDGRKQMIPRHNRYYGYFGKLGRAENTQWKDPNRRNFKLRGI